MSKNTTLTTHDISEPRWGLRRSVSPCFGARLVQRETACIIWMTGRTLMVSSAMRICAILTKAFPVLLKQLELMLTSGELNPRHQHGVTLYAKGLICEADTLGSHGYVYIAIYPTPVATA